MDAVVDALLKEAVDKLNGLGPRMDALEQTELEHKFAEVVYPPGHPPEADEDPEDPAGKEPEPDLGLEGDSEDPLNLPPTGDLHTLPAKHDRYAKHNGRRHAMSQTPHDDGDDDQPGRLGISR
jgi:hypothetical protein